MSEFQILVEQLKHHGAKRIFIKPLANNDNSKQQIYLGADFEVIRAIPSGDVYSAGMSSKGAIFKAPLDLYWIDLKGETDLAPNAQIILYPKYPETRLSGFLSGCSRKKGIAPSHLMQPPTAQERVARLNTKRYLVLGVDEQKVWAHCSAWDGALHDELKAIVESGNARLVAPVFYEYSATQESSEEKLLRKLKEIFLQGPIESCRLNSDGELITYKAQNGAGYTLEAQFGITPNGSSDPDFIDWELKSHSAGAVTLMTPEPNVGTYLDDLEVFLRAYGTRIEPERMDFASRHNVGQKNKKTALTMRFEGYDPDSGEILEPDGGLMLRDDDGVLVAGWKFDKLIFHWKKKHTNTCFVAYSAIRETPPKYQYGPKVVLGKGTNLKLFLHALYLSTVYYDPGVNMKLLKGKWKPKKRNQFRISWRDIDALYVELREVSLDVL
ncbi:MvaI/BcnI family restriction endonuclease [Thiopseudomonas acetoxidans]|uniref:MvaI/BcnI family restriction endonuclease n=1 Tax=Thiopseudomonas acetoxidans TaxID=3041622 RepID=A0ABT7SQ20_9GAMM|nr:MvaI/BcnI family restriction endonuclease [Thiopseudomonas sp. CY1220]MDM7857642.1 MvaI/BcnI family restriction endonuclease [Thiopseudomonas sp. CY1220]